MTNPLKSPAKTSRTGLGVDSWAIGFIVVMLVAAGVFWIL